MYNNKLIMDTRGYVGVSSFIKIMKQTTVKHLSLCFQYYNWIELEKEINGSVNSNFIHIWIKLISFISLCIASKRS